MWRRSRQELLCYCTEELGSESTSYIGNGGGGGVGGGLGSYGFLPLSEADYIRTAASFSSFIPTSSHDSLRDSTATLPKHEAPSSLPLEPSRSMVTPPTRRRLVSPHLRHRTFPPPLSSLVCEDPPVMRSFKANGRFMLRRVENARRSPFRATRKDGRLMLELVCQRPAAMEEEEDGDDDDDEEDHEEAQGGGEMDGVGRRHIEQQDAKGFKYDDDDNDDDDERKEAYDRTHRQAISAYLPPSFLLKKGQKTAVVPSAGIAALAKQFSSYYWRQASIPPIKVPSTNAEFHHHNGPSDGPSQKLLSGRSQDRIPHQSPQHDHQHEHQYSPHYHHHHYQQQHHRHQPPSRLRLGPLIHKLGLLFFHFESSHHGLCISGVCWFSEGSDGRKHCSIQHFITDSAAVFSRGQKGFNSTLMNSTAPMQEAFPGL